MINTKTIEELELLIDSVDESNLELRDILSAFVELLNDTKESLDPSLNLLFDLLQNRPDLILNQLDGLSEIGLVKSINLVKGSKQKLQISSYLDSGFTKNWNGSGCDRRQRFSNIEQTMTISSDESPRYSNRHNLQLKLSDLPEYTPYILNDKLDLSELNTIISTVIETVAEGDKVTLVNFDDDSNHRRTKEDRGMG